MSEVEIHVETLVTRVNTNPASVSWPGTRGCNYRKTLTITLLWLMGLSQKTRDVLPMLVQCCASVADGGPALNQHWGNASYLTLFSHFFLAYANCFVSYTKYKLHIKHVKRQSYITARLVFFRCVYITFMYLKLAIAWAMPVSNEVLTMPHSKAALKESTHSALRRSSHFNPFGTGISYQYCLEIVLKTIFFMKKIAIMICGIHYVIKKPYRCW